MKHYRPDNGFTLLELVIVLAIIAVVTSLATLEISQVQDQHRFEASQQGLEAIRYAVLGSPDDRSPDGARTVTGFVADMGRLPLSLEELWTNTPPSFGVRRATVGNVTGSGRSDPDVLVAGGRRARYIRLPLGASDLRDGWGNAYTNWQDSGIWYVAHLGADGEPGGSNYNEDVTLTITTNDTDASLWGYVTVFNDSMGIVTGAVVVCAFGPSPVEPDRITTASVTVPDVAVSPTNAQQVAWSLAGLTPGPRAVRAYAADFGATSHVSTVTLFAGPNGPVNFYLRSE